MLQLQHKIYFPFLWSSPTCTRNGHRHRVTYTRCCVDTIDSPDDEHEVTRNMWRIGINTSKRIWSDFDRASSLLCGNKMSTRCNRWYLLQIVLYAQHVSGNTMPIIRSSRALYRWSLPAATICMILSRSWWWAQYCPKHVDHAIKSAINIICCI